MNDNEFNKMKIIFIVAMTVLIGGAFVGALSGDSSHGGYRSRSSHYSSSYYGE